jgi:hypothetical protein
MLALDLDEGVAEYSQKVLVGGHDRSVELELNHGLRPVESSHSRQRRLCARPVRKTQHENPLGPKPPRMRGPRFKNRVKLI